MLLPVVLLTFYAAIFHEFTCGTYLEFDVIYFRFAAVGTHNFVRLAAAHHGEALLNKNIFTQEKTLK